MKIQRTDWGYIEWRHIHDENDKKQLMDIRISVVLPGKSQPKHILIIARNKCYTLCLGKGFIL